MVVLSEWDVQRDAATGLQLEVSTGRLRILFQKAPVATFRKTREAFESILSGHRTHWLASKNVSFRPGGLNPTGIRSSDPTASGWFRARSFHFVVKPSAKAAPSGAVPNLESIQAEAFSESPAAQGLEEGGVKTPRRGRYLALPIGVTLDSLGRPKSRWNTPTRYKRFGNNKLVSIRRPGEAPVLYQVKRGRKAAQQAGAIQRASDGKLKARERRILLPAYVLVPRVRRKARLRFLDTWDRLEANRGRLLGTGLAAVVKELEGGS